MIAKDTATPPLTTTTDSTTTFSLKCPITVAGKQIDQLQMRAPRVGDLKAAARFGGSDAEQEVALMAILCGLVPEDVDQMHLKDWRRVQETFRAALD